VKISREKNLAFADQPAPMLFKDVEQIKPRTAIKPIPKVSIELRKAVATVGRPEVESLLDEKTGQPILRIKNFNLGVHQFPPNVQAKGIPSLGSKSPSFSKALESQGFLPDHLAFRPVPEPLEPRLKVRPFHLAYPRMMAYLEMERKYGSLTTTVFPPDDRLVFNDTSYPWSTCGRVDSPNGFGSGVMVGPRHLLTASHMIQWNDDGSTGWVRFRPAYFAPSEPFGDAWAIKIYFKFKVKGPIIDSTEEMFDYVVCVLDNNIGNSTGWMGSKGYTDSWDGGTYWSHVGYPGGLTAGNKPTFQKNISLDGAAWEDDSHESMFHRADVEPGQSGGPFFGYWDNKPYVAATQSGQTSAQNNASGGQDLVDLILRALRDFP